MLGRGGRVTAPTGLRSLVDIYLRYGVPHKIDEARGGWVSTHCPYCTGSADYHLGFSLAHSYFRCWRCGYHDAVRTLAMVCQVERSMALDLYRTVRSGHGGVLLARRDREVQAKVSISRYRRPDGVGPMDQTQRRYLERRGFDPDRIEREWNVLGTGPTSRLDYIDYRFRLLIPICWGGAEVSFTTRDVTGKSEYKYLACPTDREITHHKHILYGKPECWGETGIIVEGVTDVWRLGPKACAVFGIQYRVEQMREIVRHFRRVVIVFDAERQAQAQARRLAADLRMTRLDDKLVVIDLGGGIDPGSMAQDDAEHLVRSVT
jgi:hypothetical protein